MRQFTTENGLPHNVCYEVMEDKHGNVWFGTDNGLVKYTLQGLEIFSEKDGLAGPYVIELEEYLNDTILISNWGHGLGYYYRGQIGLLGGEKHANGKYRNMQVNSVGDMLFQSAEGKIFYDDRSQGNSLSYYLTKDYQVSQTLPPREYFKIPKVHLGEDGKAVLFKNDFVVTVTSNFKVTDIKKSYAFLNAKEPNCFHATENRLWYGMNDGELVSRDQSFKIDAIKNRDIIQITSVDKDRLLLLVRSKTYVKDYEVVVFNTQDQSLVSLSNELILEGVPSSLEFSERSGTWLSTDGNGIYQVEENIFQHIEGNAGLLQQFVNGISEDFTGKIFLSTKGGVFYAKRDSYKFKEIEGFGNAPITFFGRDDQHQQFYISSEDRKLPTFLTKSQNDRVSLEACNVFGFLGYLVKQDNKVIVSRETITVYNNTSPISSRYDLPVLSVRKCISSEIDEGVWLGTTSGLFKFNGTYVKGKTSFREDEWQFADSITIADRLPSNSIRDMAYDAEGYLWIATAEGLAKWSEKEKKVKAIYKIQSGLLDNDIQAIAIDRAQHIWVGTTKGLSRVSKDGVISFNKSNGLLSDDVNCLFIDSDQMLWIGGSQGASRLDLKKYNYEKKLGKLRCLEFWADGYRVDLKDDLSLDFGTGISIVVAKPGHQLSKIQFCINGQAWNDMPNGKLDLLSLGENTYEIKVRAKLLNSYWSKPLIVNFEVKPPFWRSWQAFLFYIVVVAGLITFLFRVYIKRQKRLQENKLKEVENNRLKELNTFKSRFFDNISHEFRTPLTLISGVNEEIYALPKNELKKRNQLVEISQRNVDTLLGLINQLLALSKVQDSSMTLNLEMHDFNAEVKSIVENFEILATTKKIEFQSEFPSKELFFKFDTWKLGIILNNLLSNAFKFTPEQGIVSFLVKEENEQVVVTVSDTGVGIPEDQLTKVFDRFHQADNSSTRQHEGTGIGLSLAKEFINLHGGEISVASKEGQGTSFVFTIPILDRTDAVDVESNEIQDAIVSFAQSFMQEEVDDSEIVPSGRPKVLVVEDNADMRWYLNSILSRYYDVLLAEDGEKGLAEAIEHLPSLIVSDVMMPKMDGMELCSHLKQDERTSHIPLILLTAKASREHKISGLSIGADDYLGKPFDREELEVRIANLIAIRQKLVDKFSSEPESSVQELATTELDAEFLAQANEIILDHLADSKFKSAQFVEKMGMSRTLVHNKMKALAGQTTSEFIKAIRLKKAADIIKTTDESLAHIGYLVGFNDPSYFSRSFSKMFGVTPSEYQKKIANELT